MTDRLLPSEARRGLPSEARRGAHDFQFSLWQTPAQGALRRKPIATRQFLELRSGVSARLPGRCGVHESNVTEKPTSREAKVYQFRRETDTVCFTRFTPQRLRFV